MVAFAPPTIYSVGSSDHDYCLQTPNFLGGRAPTQTLGFSLQPQDDSGCPACEWRNRAVGFSTSSTAAPPVCAPPSLWPPQSASSASASGRHALTPYPRGTRFVPLPP